MPYFDKEEWILTDEVIDILDNINLDGLEPENQKEELNINHARNPWYYWDMGYIYDF